MSARNSVPSNNSKTVVNSSPPPPPPPLNVLANCFTVFLFFFFSQLKVGDKLFENVHHAFSFVADKEYGSLDERVDRDQ